MKLTRHSLMRMKQRNFSDVSINIILQYGHISNAPGGATKIIFNNKEYQLTIKELKAAIRLMERAKNGTIVMVNDYIVTVYRQ